MINFSGTPALVIATANIRRITPTPFTSPSTNCADCVPSCENPSRPTQIATGTENDDYDIYIRWAVGNSWVYATPTSTSSSPTVLARMRGTTNFNTTNNYQRGILLQGFTDTGTSYCANSRAFNNQMVDVPVSAEGPAWRTTAGYVNATYDKYNFYIPQDQIFKKIYIIYKIYTTTINGVTYYGNGNLSQTVGTAIAAYNFWKKGTPPTLCCPNNLRIKSLTNARFENNVADTTAFESSANNFNDINSVANRGTALVILGCLKDLGYGKTTDPYTSANGSFVHSLNWELADSISYKGNNQNYTSLF
jgi:hypothetical protein